MSWLRFIFCELLPLLAFPLTGAAICIWWREFMDIMAGDQVGYWFFGWLTGMLILGLLYYCRSKENGGEGKGKEK